MLAYTLSLDLDLQALLPILSWIAAVLGYLTTGVQLARRLIAADRARTAHPDPKVLRRIDPSKESLVGALVLAFWPAVVAFRILASTVCLAGRGLARLTVPPVQDAKHV